MKNLLVFFVSSLLIFLFSINLSLAQAPEGVNYQAVVRNSLGIPLNNQTVSVRFTIHQGSPTGTAVFQEVHATTTNQFGLVNLELGSVNNGAFSVINWGTGGAYYLQIEVDAGAGYDNLGASQLLSVPYALFAKSAATGAQGFNSLIDTVSAGASCPNGGYQVLAGLDANANTVLDPGEVTSSFFVCNGSNGAANLSDTSATNELQTLTISNDTIFLSNGGFVVLPALGADGDWTINGNDMTSGVIGNVGIGTPVTPQKLTVFSTDTAIASFTGSNVNGAGIAVRATNPSAKVGTIYLNGADSSIIAMDPTNKTFFMTNMVSGGHTILYADSVVSLNGEVVANVANSYIYNQADTIYNEADTIFSFSSSGSILQVNQGSFLTDSLFVFGSNFNMPNWVLASDGSGKAVWKDPASFSGSGLWQSNAPDIYFNTGNVGVGTTTPFSLLEIEGNNAAMTLDATSGNPTLALQEVGTTMWDFGHDAGSNTFYIRETPTTNVHFVLQNGGNVGLGTLSPTEKLHLFNGTLRIDDGVSPYSLPTADGAIAGQVMTTDALGNVTWQTPSGSLWQSNVPDLYFNTGNVGIGTNTPATALHVNGQITVADGAFATPSYVFDGTQTGFYRGAGDRIEFVNSGSTSLQIYQNQLRVKRGTTATPGVVWSDETTTGVFGPGGNEIGFVTAGTESMRIDGTGRVGIGTSVPSYNLEVVGETKTDSIVITGGAAAGFVLTSDAAGNASWQLPSTTTVSRIQDLDNNTWIETDLLATGAEDKIRFALNGTERMIIDNNGMVGIGTVTPGAPLHIANGAFGSSGSVALMSNNANATAASNVSFFKSRGSEAAPTAILQNDEIGVIEFNAYNSVSYGNAGLIRTIADENFGSTAMGSHMEFHIAPLSMGSAVEVMRIANTGNVGVGTNNPLARLHVAEEGQATVGIQASHNGLAEQGANVTMIRSRGTITAPTNVWAGDRLGKVEWAGYNSGSGSFDEVASIRAFADEAYTGGSTSSHLEFHVNPAGQSTMIEAMRINGSGLVGLGTGTPTSKLHVMSGTITIDDGANPYTFPAADGAANNVLTTDGAGNVSWTAPSGGSLWQSSTPDIYFNTGKVGIGTATPATTMEIYNNTPELRLTSSQTTSAASAYLRLGDEQGGSFQQRGWVGLPGSGNYLEIGSPTAVFFNTNFSYRMVISGTGNVGIGTTGPTEKLHVQGGSIKIDDGASPYTLPASDGTSGDIMVTDGAGNASWKLRQVAFQARPGGTGQAFGAGAWLDLNTIEFNDNGNYSAATSEFVAPIPGVYHFTAMVDIQASGFSTPNLIMYKNGVQVLAETSKNVQTGDRLSMQVAVTVQLDTGDAINLFMHTGGGPSVQIQSIGGTSFSGHLVYAY